MNELKKKVLEIITAINRDWSEAINKASTEDKGLDLSDMSVKFSEKIMLLEPRSEIIPVVRQCSLSNFHIRWMERVYKFMLMVC